MYRQTTLLAGRVINQSTYPVLCVESFDAVLSIRKPSHPTRVANACEQYIADAYDDAVDVDKEAFSFQPP